MSRVLLVDDDKNLLRIAQMLLIREEPTFNLVTTTSSREALRRLRENHFDVVVADYQMPGMDGLELLECLRQEGNMIPFIIFTGRGREEVAMQALNLGANYYLMKGDKTASTFGELAHIIRQVVEYKRTEEELRQSEARFRTIFHNANDAILVIQLLEDRNLGCFLEVNDIACQRYGYSREEFLQMTPKDLNAPGHFERLQQAGLIGNVLQEEPITLETVHRAKNGKRIPVEITGLLITLNGERVRLAIARDISERVRADAALRESESEKTLILQSTAEVIVYQDRDLRIKWANEAAANTIGLAPEEILGRYCYKVWRQRTSPCVDCPVIKAIETGEVHQRESTTTDGRIWNDRGYPVRDEKGDIIGAVEVAMEITECKRTEKKLRESERNYRMMVEHSLQGVVILQEMHIAYANPLFEEMTGYTLNELQVLSPQEIMAHVHPEDQDIIRTDFRECMAGRPGPSCYEFRFFRKNGTLCWVKVFPTRIDYQGKPAAQGVCIDITERKQTEEHLKQQKTELSEYVHAMAHDLRNSLLTIEGYADILRNEADLAYAEKIGQLARRMNVILSRSVNLADAGLVIDKTVEVNLTDLIQEVAETAIPENVAFAQDSLPTVVGDREKLSQVFQNLFENAVVHGQPHQIAVRRRDSKDGTDLLITNDGGPIPHEHRSKIFDRGFTTKEEGGGLGLAIIKKLVKAHGWQISLEETAETTFRIFIPMPRKP